MINTFKQMGNVACQSSRKDEGLAAQCDREVSNIVYSALRSKGETFTESGSESLVGSLCGMASCPLRGVDVASNEVSNRENVAKLICEMFGTNRESISDVTVKVLTDEITGLLARVQKLASTD